MPSLQTIRRRIGSVKNTQKITRAMKLVSAAKLRRAQEKILAARPYAEKMEGVVARLAARATVEHPLLGRDTPVRRLELLVISTDRGLCGSFNANLFRRVLELTRAHQAGGGVEPKASTPVEPKASNLEVGLTLIGRKSRDFFRRRGVPIHHTMVGLFDRLKFAHAQEIATGVRQRFLEGAFDACDIVYNEFRSAISQKVVARRLLPVPQAELVPGEDVASYLYEPDEDELLEALLPRQVEIQVWRGLLESTAAEQGARMLAMDSASRNAGEMIRRLTLVYNKTRQAAITKELMDIVGGAEALK